MAEIVGGLRARLIRESLYQMIWDSLDALNWFNMGNPAQPVTFVSKQQDQDQQIAFNTGAISDENLSGIEMELGSGLTEHRWIFYLDFFAENDAIGLHFIRDVKDILEGRYTTVNRFDPSFDVYDYRQSTPPILFKCQIEDVTVDRAHGFLKPWLQHWYSVAFAVVDYYDRDDG